ALAGDGGRLRTRSAAQSFMARRSAALMVSSQWCPSRCVSRPALSQVLGFARLPPIAAPAGWRDPSGTHHLAPNTSTKRTSHYGSRGRICSATDREDVPNVVDFRRRSGDRQAAVTVSLLPQ